MDTQKLSKQPLQIDLTCFGGRWRNLRIKLKINLRIHEIVTFLGVRFFRGKSTFRIGLQINWNLTFFTATPMSSFAFKSMKIWCIFLAVKQTFELVPEYAIKVRRNATFDAKILTRNFSNINVKSFIRRCVVSRLGEWKITRNHRERVPCLKGLKIWASSCGKISWNWRILEDCPKNWRIFEQSLVEKFRILEDRKTDEVMSKFREIDAFLRTEKGRKHSHFRFHINE